MSKPWDNEETPLTDAASQLWTTTGDEYNDAVKSADVRNIERRMRAAERLLRETSKYVMHVPLWRDAINHLDAAVNEDSQ